jgi:WD40 repeat protein
MPSEKKLYAFSNLPAHLYDAGDEERLRELLGSYSFLTGKVQSRLVPNLVSDYDFLPEGSPLRLVQAAVRMSAHVIGSDPEQLAGQLHGRLLHRRGEAEIAELLDAAQEHHSGSLVPATASLTQVGGARLLTFPGYRSGIGSIALTRCGDRVVAASSDRTIRIFSLATGSELLVLRGHGGRVTAVRLTPDDRRVISGSDDRTLRIWSLESGAQEAEIPMESSVNVLEVIPHGGQVMAGLEDGSIQSVDLVTGAMTRLSGYQERINGLALTPDSRHLLAASGDGTLMIWDLATRTAERFAGKIGRLSAVVVTAEGDRAFCNSQDATIGIWSLAERRQVAMLEGHRRPVSELALSRDGRTLVSLAGDRTLRVWDSAEGRLLRIIPVSRTGPLALTPDVSRALIGLTVWDLSASGEAPELIDNTAIRALAMAPSGRVVISASADRALKIWDTESGREIRTLAGHARAVEAVAVASNGRWAVSGSSDHTIKVWDLDNGREIRTITGHTSEVMSVSITADGQRLVSGGIRREVRVWSMEDGQSIYSRRAKSGYLNAVAATPDGRFAVLGVYDETEDKDWPVIFDIEAGQEVGQLRGHEAAVESVLVIQEGRQVLTGSRDTTVRLWDLASRRELRRLEGHEEGIVSLAVTQDGRYAASASFDATLRVWRLDTGKCLATFHGEEAITACALTPDARLLIAGEESGQLHIFRIRMLA